MKARVIRLRPNSGGGGQLVRVKTTMRLIQAIQGQLTPTSWFDGSGFCIIKKRCVTVRRPRGWESWVYFEEKP